jgi:hypothetical protein
MMLDGAEEGQLSGPIGELVPFTTRGATAKPTRSPRTTPALHNSSTTSAPGSPTNPPCHLSATRRPHRVEHSPLPVEERVDLTSGPVAGSTNNQISTTAPRVGGLGDVGAI